MSSAGAPHRRVMAARARVGRPPMPTCQQGCGVKSEVGRHTQQTGAGASQSL